MGEDNSNPEIKSGIGVINVMRRLQIIYKKNVVSIKSKPNWEQKQK